MCDRRVRQIVLGLILAFPVLVTAMSPASARPTPLRDALLPLAAVETVLITGLYGAYRARLALLASRDELASEPRKSLTPAHFMPSAASPVFEATPR